MADKGKYYITTAIAYTSGKPHIGNTYEIILADAIARWKRQEGYDVTTLYATTHQRDSVRALIRTVARPDYLLLVGDAGELQSFVASAPSLELGSHITDLPYADYTGDGLPDVCYGRWTVNNAAELSVVVQKTLRYEQFCDMDTALLRRTLLVAGQEGTQPAPITTNGQVNYLKDELRVSHPEIDTLCYYNPTSGNQLPALKAVILFFAHAPLFS